ncbi:MAG: M18 family aminopeptidase [Clostridiales bacterium]|nr:M18 family aminopeptidase [Clostridiales bacterium]
MDTLFECLRQGTAPEKVVAFAKKYLKKEGFEELYYDKMFCPKLEGRYYISPFPDVLFAFTMGRKSAYLQSVRMGFAHVDQPCFKVKSRPEWKSMESSLLNAEVYGGIKDHTWFDRPLGLAGTIMLKGEDVFRPESRLYDSERPVAIIPGLAIHMNREANNGWKIDRQKELMPVTGLAGASWAPGAFAHFLAGELDVDDSEILNYDLNLYNYDEPQLVGLSNELISSPRLDNLVSVSALLESLVEGERTNGINFIGLFNHEEVGSMTRSGADSELLEEILRGIFRAMDCQEEIFRASMADSFYLSVDGAQGAHPNYPDRCDPTTRAYLGQGAAIKGSGTFKYASDIRMQAILLGLAEKYDIMLQTINDRNTIRGGKTIGSMIGAHIPMTGCDIGAPMWAMHSARETMAASDYDSLCRILTAFFAY